MENNDYIEVLSSCVHRVDGGAGWWCALPVPGRKDDAITQDVFPSINTLFGSRKEAMAIFWAEAGWETNKDSSMVFSHNRHNKLKESVVTISSIEISRASSGGGRLKWCIKLGHQTSRSHIA